MLTKAKLEFDLTRYKDFTLNFPGFQTQGKFSNTPHYNMDLDITIMSWLLNFYHGILQRNDRTMTILWSFS